MGSSTKIKMKMKKKIKKGKGKGKEKIASHEVRWKKNGESITFKPLILSRNPDVNLSFFRFGSKF